ncbi:unnamed protein product [Allacma fusca]|uniref:Regulatory protein zeste n=1 Tax=Allacma fusca TaxID=39272 RepID=A0A8J2LLU1_9HEXA|nr:unnamed protein product [Allacma fusca]
MEAKNVLFAKVSDKLTNEDKIAAWTEVAVKARSIGVLKPGQDAKYLRDNTWQNWRKRTMAKRDNQKKTGASGGENCKFDEADLIVFDIIGIDSPVLYGINLSESSGTTEATVALSCGKTDKENVEPDNELEEPAYKREKPGPKIGQAAKRGELQRMRTQKFEAQVELIKKENRIRYLQMLKLEKELGTGPSEFTQQFYSQPLVVELITAVPESEVNLE